MRAENLRREQSREAWKELAAVRKMQGQRAFQRRVEHVQQMQDAMAVALEQQRNLQPRCRVPSRGCLTTSTLTLAFAEMDWWSNSTLALSFVPHDGPGLPFSRGAPVPLDEATGRA